MRTQKAEFPFALAFNTTFPLGNSLQTRGPGGSSYSTTPLGNSLVTRGTSTKKDEGKATGVIVMPAGTGR
jgi:hypothetical protein